MKASRRTDGSSRLSLVLGILLMLAVGAALVHKLLGSRTANAPSGMAGARFGWSESVLRASVPGLVALPPSAEASYPRLRGRVEVYDEPATCTYELAAGSTLSRVDCVFDAAPGQPAHARKAEKLLVTLRQLYGAESSSKPAFSEWRNREAAWALYTTEPGPSALPLIRLINTSKLHHAALAQETPTRQELAADGG